MHLNPHCFSNVLEKWQHRTRPSPVYCTALYQAFIWMYVKLWRTHSCLLSPCQSMWTIWSYFVTIHLCMISYLTQNKQQPKQGHHDSVCISISTSLHSSFTKTHRQLIICSLVCQTGAATVVPVSLAWYVRTVHHIMMDGRVTCLWGFSAPHHLTNRGSETSHHPVKLGFNQILYAPHAHTSLPPRKIRARQMFAALLWKLFSAAT